MARTRPPSCTSVSSRPPDTALTVIKSAATKPTNTKIGSHRMSSRVIRGDLDNPRSYADDLRGATDDAARESPSPLLQAPETLKQGSRMLAVQAAKADG